MGWSLERYKKATVYEFNEAARGYWRNWERNVKWMTREILWEMIIGNPYYDKNDKPKNKKEIMELSFDPSMKEVEKARETARKPTRKELQHAENILRGLKKN